MYCYIEKRDTGKIIGIYNTIARAKQMMNNNPDKDNYDWRIVSCSKKRYEELRKSFEVLER